jgi:hypothetical protein
VNIFFYPDERLICAKTGHSDEILICRTQVFDIKEDVKESYELWGNEGYVHAWVMSPVMKILDELQDSMVKCLNIKSGQEFSGYQ